MRTESASVGLREFILIRKNGVQMYNGLYNADCGAFFGVQNCVRELYKCTLYILCTQRYIIISAPNGFVMRNVHPYTKTAEFFLFSPVRFSASRKRKRRARRGSAEGVQRPFAPCTCDMELAECHRYYGVTFGKPNVKHGEVTNIFSFSPV